MMGAVKIGEVLIQVSEIQTMTDDLVLEATARMDESLAVSSKRRITCFTFRMNLRFLLKA
jgi:hypothetical protein